MNYLVTYILIILSIFFFQVGAATEKKYDELAQYLSPKEFKLMLNVLFILGVILFIAGLVSWFMIHKSHSA